MTLHTRHQLNQRINEASKASGVYWSTYNLHQWAMKASRKAKTPPKFRRWDQTGRLAVQLQKGRTVGQIWGGEDLQLAISVEDGPQGKQTAGSRRAGTRGQLRMRISSEDRKPVWARWPLILHRPLPPEARIQAAVVSRRACATGWKWQLMLTIRLPADWQPTQWSVQRREHVLKRSGSDGAVALNVGFALRENGIRAGYLVGSDGYEHEVLVRQHTLDGIAKANGIRSERDRLFNEARGLLVDWLASREEVPEWLSEKTKGLPLWRAQKRLADLIHNWWDTRIPRDEELYPILHAWKDRYRHLLQYEVGLRDHVFAHRREQYRILAVEMSRRYRWLITDNTDLRKFQQSPKPESETVEFEAVKRQQNIANPSGLRLTLITVFGPKRHVIQEASDKSRIHATCGALSAVDKTKRLQTCNSCGGVYDQDANNGQNHLIEWASGSEQRSLG